MADQEFPNLGVNEPAKPPSVAERMANAVKQAWQELRVGDDHAMGMARLGGHELTNALQAFPDSNIRPMEEAGVFGNGNAPQYRPEQSYDDMVQSYAARGGPAQDHELER